MSDVKGTVNLPKFKDKEYDEDFRKHALTLSVAIAGAVNEYLKEFPEDQAPNAYSVGAACFIAAYLIGETFPDDRKTQVADGLTACLALNNEEFSSLSLANLPP